MNAPTKDRKHDGLPLPRRRWAALALASGLVITIMDASMVIVMLPVIAQTFDVDPSVAIWVMTAYQLTFACLILPFAALGEKYGHWLVYCGGIALFSMGAIFSGLSGTLAMLLLGRVLQGIGAASAHSMTMVLVRHSYPHHLFGRAAGTNSSVVGLSMAAGPSAGAAILLLADWRFMFMITLPFAIFATVAGVLALPRVSRPSMRYDIAGAVLTIAFILLLVLGLNEMRAGSSSFRLVAFLGSAALILTLLFLRLRGRADPMLPIDLLGHRVIAMSLAGMLGLFMAQAATMIALPFKLLASLDMSPGAVGMLLTPWPVCVGLVASTAGRLADRYSARLLCGSGAALLLSGVLLILFLPEQPTVMDVLWRVAFCGLGFGLFATPNNRLVILNSPLTRASAGGGLVATTRLLGQTFGATFAAVAFSYWPARGADAALEFAALSAFVTLVVVLTRRTD